VPSADFSHTVTIAAEPGSAWARMQDPQTWVGLGPIDRVGEATVDGRGHLQGFRWGASVAGRRWEGTARTVRSEPGTEMEVALESSELRASVTASLTPHGDGHSRMVVELSARSAGLLAGMFWGAVEQAIRRSLPEQAAAFGHRLAPGRTP
jgi:carbon monoxide dehydrogenase subunit G